MIAPKILPLAAVLACATACRIFAEEPAEPAAAGASRQPDFLDSIALKGLKPRTKLHDEFVAAKEFSTPLEFEQTPGFAYAQGKDEKGATLHQVLVSRIPVGTRRPFPPTAAAPYRATDAGPLLRVHYGDPITLGTAKSDQQQRPSRVTTAALIGLHPATGEPLWGMDARGAPLPAAAIRAWHDKLSLVMLDCCNKHSLSAVRLMLVLDGNGTPLALGRNFIRRDDTGDVFENGLIYGVECGPVNAPHTQVALFMDHPFHDAPPVTLAFELFAGTPQSLWTDDTRTCGPEGRLRVRRLGEIDSIPHFDSGSGLTPAYEGQDMRQKRLANLGNLALPALLPLLRENDAGLCYFMNGERARPGRTFFFGLNEGAHWARFPFHPAKKPGATHSLDCESGDDFTLFSCASETDPAPAPLRLPHSARVLLKLPQLPGHWPNRGVAEPLDWKLSLPRVAGSGMAQFSGNDLPLLDFTAGGLTVFERQPLEEVLIPKEQAEGLTLREILRRAYAPQIRQGNRAHVDNEARRITILAPDTPPPAENPFGDAPR